MLQIEKLFKNFANKLDQPPVAISTDKVITAFAETVSEFHSKGRQFFLQPEIKKLQSDIISEKEGLRVVPRQTTDGTHIGASAVLQAYYEGIPLRVKAETKRIIASISAARENLPKGL